MSNPTACDDETCITIHGDIEAGGVNAAKVIAQIAAKTCPELHVRIHSNGGDVYDGIAIYNALKNYPGRVVTHVDGVAASMASVIALAGEEVCMAANAMMMIHNPNISFSGDALSLKNSVGLMERVQNILARAYVAKSGRPMAEVLSAMQAETWFTADEAMDFGFCDTIEIDDNYASTIHEKTPVQLVAAAYRTRPHAASASPVNASKLSKELSIMAKQIARPKAEDMPAMPAEPAAPAVPEVVPVDTSSDIYKAGVSAGKAGVVNPSDPVFLAGLAAGAGAAAAEPEIPVEVTAEGEEVPKEEEDDEEEEKPTAKLKIADIRAAFSSDPEFMWDALAMSEAGKSLVHIKAAYADRLQAKNTDLQAKLVKATSGQRAIGTGATAPNASANPKDPKAVAAAEWDSDTTLHGKFTTKERFVAVRAAELSGRLRISAK